MNYKRKNGTFQWRNLAESIITKWSRSTPPLTGNAKGVWIWCGGEDMGSFQWYPWRRCITWAPSQGDIRQTQTEGYFIKWLPCVPQKCPCHEILKYQIPNTMFWLKEKQRRENWMQHVFVYFKGQYWDNWQNLNKVCGLENGFYQC